MKNLYYIHAQKRSNVFTGVPYTVYFQSFEGFQCALAKFHDLVFLRNCYGTYKNIFLFRYDEKGRRVFLRQA